MKKLIALLCVVAALFSLVACAQAPAEKPAEDKPAASTPAETPDAPAEEPAEEPEAPAEEPEAPAEEITLVYQTVSAQDMVTAAFAVYQESHPNVKLDVQVVDNANLGTKSMSQLETNTLPDFSWNNLNVWKDGFEQTDSMYDVTDIIKNDIGEANLHPDVLKKLSSGDSYYALPAEMQIQGFLINTALFEQYGLEIPENFADLLNAAKVFRDNGNVLFGSGTKDTWPTWTWYNWLQLYGIEEDKEALFKDHSLMFADAQASNMYYRLTELHEAGAFPDNNATITYEQSKTMFAAEQCGIIPTSTDQLTGIVNEAIDDGRVQYWYGITFEDSTADQALAVKTVNNGFGISANITEDKLAALIDFLKFFYSTEGANAVIAMGLTLPVTCEINADVSPLVKSIIELTQDTTRKAVQGASYSWFEWHNMDINYFLDFHFLHEEAMNGAIDGNVTAADLPDMLAEMDELIQAGKENWEADNP